MIKIAKVLTRLLISVLVYAAISTILGLLVNKLVSPTLVPCHSELFPGTLSDCAGVIVLGNIIPEPTLSTIVIVSSWAIPKLIALIAAVIAFIRLKKIL